MSDEFDLDDTREIGAPWQPPLAETVVTGDLTTSTVLDDTQSTRTPRMRGVSKKVLFGLLWFDLTLGACALYSFSRANASPDNPSVVINEGTGTSLGTRVTSVSVGSQVSEPGSSATQVTAVATVLTRPKTVVITTVTVVVPPVVTQPVAPKQKATVCSP